MPKMIALHDVLEPLKQALLASRDVIISSQICVSKLQRVFTLGDGCWLPIMVGTRRFQKAKQIIETAERLLAVLALASLSVLHIGLIGVKPL